MHILLKKGFTLAEIMITLSIVTVIMTTVLFSYSVFSDKLALSSAAQEIAITIRQAQTYGLTVREAAVAGGNFNSAYGVYFDIGSDQTHYYLFVDTNSNSKYDVGNGCGSASTECVQQGTIRSNVLMTNVCDGSACPPVVNVKKMNVTFLRPNPDATIIFTDSSGNTLAGPSSTGKVVLTSPKGNTSTITIESTGQVNVQ